MIVMVSKSVRYCLWFGIDINDAASELSSPSSANFYYKRNWNIHNPPYWLFSLCFINIVMNCPIDALLLPLYASVIILSNNFWINSDRWIILWNKNSGKICANSAQCIDHLQASQIFMEYWKTQLLPVINEFSNHNLK